MVLSALHCSNTIHQLLSRGTAHQDVVFMANNGKRCSLNTSSGVFTSCRL